MQNDMIENVRPFARLVAIEAATEDMDVVAKKGTFHSLPSGGAITDIPDPAGMTF
jgi:hypothetical protein